MRKNSLPKRVGVVSLACMVYFPNEGLSGICRFVFHKLCLHMHVNKMKIKRNSSLE